MGDPAGSENHGSKRGSGAILVAAGILFSRVAGFVRESIFAHYFGNSAAADAFKAALRIPNFLQNLFGEGVLSASFIPVYSALMAHGDEEDARRTASAVGLLLSLVSVVFSLLGFVFTPQLIDVITPGFEGAERELAIALVRIFFPGTAMLVMSAWCLGILNSHRKFFLSYTAPVIWNGAIIAALVLFSGRPEREFAVLVGWGVTVGSLLQFAVQLPTALRLLRKVYWTLGLHLAPLRQVLRNFVPVVIGRGVVQIIGFIDSMIASLLPRGAIAALAYAQTLYFLPISLFAMSVSAAELPSMSGAKGGLDEIKEFLRGRVAAGERQIAFFVIPSAAAFYVLGDVVVAALYQSGKFTRTDTLYVWATLAGMSIGLFATTRSRLYAAAFYALKDTRTPLRIGLVRAAFAVVVGVWGALYLPDLAGFDRQWGIVGLTAAAGISSWLEFGMLRRALTFRIGNVPSAGPAFLRMWGAALASAAAALVLKLQLPALRPLPLALIDLGFFGGFYLVSALLLHLDEARMVVDRARRVARF